jgi:RNA polymerase sigma-70 factor (ECF subfamily)
MAASTLDDALASAHAKGLEAWPEVELAPARFTEYLRERLPEGVPPEEALDRLAIGDLYLAAAVAAGDPRAIAVFDRVLGNEITAAADAARIDAATRDEATQIVRTLLLLPRPERPPAILDYAGRGPLRGWLRVTATRELLRVVKKSGREVALEEHLLDAPAIGDDPALAALKDQYREALAAAFRETLEQLGARERTLLRYQLVDGLNIDEIGAIYQVHRATAARWMVKVRDELVERTHSRLAVMLKIDTDEVPSVVRLVQSQLEVSVIKHLKK